MRYKINEIFYSLQGEGVLQGIPLVFVRFAGCNLRCSFCDTKKAWKNGIGMSVEEIVCEIGKYPCKRVCLTGGEPFLQNLSPLVKILKEKKYWIGAETNGTIWKRLNIDWLTVSPKREGKKFHLKGYDERFRKTAKEFKYVITEEKDLKRLDKKIKCPIILQPVNNSMKITKKIIGFLKNNSEKNWHLRLQLHKIIGIQ